MSDENPFFDNTVSLNNIDYEFDFDGDIEINKSDLDREFSRQAAAFARYATGYELALHEEKLFKAARERLEAHLDHQGRMENSAMVDSHGKPVVKMTEKMAENYVKGHAQYEEATLKYLQAQRITGLLKQGKDAMIQKQFMLQALGKVQLQEYNSDISMKLDYVNKK